MDLESRMKAKKRKKKENTKNPDEISDSGEDGITECSGDKYKPFFKPVHVKTYSENSGAFEFVVFNENINSDTAISDKDIMYLSSIFSRDVKGVKRLKRVTRSKMAAILDQPGLANQLINNGTFLDKYSFKAWCEMLGDLAKEKVFWTRKMDIRLVRFLRSKRFAWDPKHPRYTSATLKDKAFTEFAAKYGHEFTGRAVKDRWINIRSTFSNYARKVESSKLLNKPDKVYEPSWHLWPACQFLYAVKRGRKEGSDLLHDSGTPVEEQFDDDENIKHRLSSEEEDNEDNYEKNGSPTGTDCRAVVEGLVSALRGIQSGILDTNHVYGKVGRLVVDKLSSMTSFEATKASIKIMEILLLYDQENPNNPNNIDGIVKDEFIENAMLQIYNTRLD